MKIALCFWGLTRSLKLTIDSIEKYIFYPLKKDNIQYDIFLHTLKLDKINYSYTNENNIKLDFNEYKLLNPTYFSYHNQEDVLKQIDFDLYKHKGDREVHYKHRVHRNAILGLFSLKQLYIMIDESKEKYDYIFFLRPDMLYLREFQTKWFRLSHGAKILTPKFGQSGGYNDRMFIGNYYQGMMFAKQIDYLPEYVKIKPYVAEHFIKWLVHKKIFRNNKTFIRFINYSFQRMRANGEIAKLDKKLNGF